MFAALLVILRKIQLYHTAGVLFTGEKLRFFAMVCHGSAM
jgi:hypothetical protein